MLKNFLYVLEFFILACIFFVAGQLVSASNFSASEEVQLFQLQNRYSQQIKNELEASLESLVGPGNAKAFVRISLKKTQLNTQKRLSNKAITTLNQSQAIVIDQQHIGLLLNTTTPFKLDSYKTFVESALGINPQMGDTLSIEILPFYQHSFFTFGLSRLTLIRLAGIMGALFFSLLLLLIFIYVKEQNTA